MKEDPPATDRIFGTRAVVTKPSSRRGDLTECGSCGRLYNTAVTARCPRCSAEKEY